MINSNNVALQGLLILSVTGKYHRTSMIHFSTCKIFRRSVRAFRKINPSKQLKSLMKSITFYLSTNDCLLPKPIPQNQFWANVFPPYQLSSNNFNSAAIGVEIRSSWRSYNFTKYVISNCDFACWLIYNMHFLFLRGELSINFTPADVSIALISSCWRVDPGSGIAEIPLFFFNSSFCFCNNILLLLLCTVDCFSSRTVHPKSNHPALTISRSHYNLKAVRQSWLVLHRYCFSGVAVVMWREFMRTVFLHVWWWKCLWP